MVRQVHLERERDEGGVKTMPAQKITDDERNKRLIKAAIALQGLTQEKLAKRRGVAQPAISKWMKCIDQMTIRDFRRMCTILRLEPGELLGR